MYLSNTIVRFLKYTSIGVGTFVLDLGLLYILTDFLELNYVIAAGMGFLLAVTLNYFLSRKFVFAGTDRSQKEGYAIFLFIAFIGLAIVTGGMYVLVEWWGVYYLFARVAVSGVTGLWNYLMNLYLNFKVVGMHN